MHALPQKITTDEAEAVAVAAFSAITGDEERMSRFLAISGLRPETIREAAASPGFFAGILDYVVSDEALLVALATETEREARATHGRASGAVAVRVRVEPTAVTDAPLCRDCLTFAPSEPAARCGVCGSPRLLRHRERDTLAIAHVDCDAFFAAVEKRDDPEPADKPVIIGGGKRGVVSTACYVARTFGVRSAMPMFKALDACPHAVVMKPDMEKYRIAGREVRELMRDLTPLVEPVSIDEAFLDLSGTERLHHGSPAVTLARFARRVEEQVGITVSVGPVLQQVPGQDRVRFREAPRLLPSSGARRRRIFWPTSRCR